MSAGASSGRRRGAKKKTHTPVMLQFLEAKERYPDALLFFRMGDFYEFFFEDALEVTELVDLTLTSRGKGPDGEPIPMAGMPHHAAPRYIAELLALGRKVAICEQLADPSTVRGVVPRGVVRVITPALCLETEALDAKTDCALVAAAMRDGGYGLAVYDMGAARLRVATLSDEAGCVAELCRLAPRELLLAPSLEHLAPTLRLAADVPTPEAWPEGDEASLDELDADGRERMGEAGAAARVAAAMVLDYAARHRAGADWVSPRVAVYDPSSQLVLDQTAVQNLELLKTLGGERAGSLLALLDRTRTPMGARKLRRRLLAPLDELAPIRRRHDAVGAFVDDGTCRAALREALGGVGDLERLTTRAEQGLASPRDLGALRDGLVAARSAAEVLAQRAPWTTDDPLAGILQAEVGAEVREELRAALVDEPPAVASAGGVIRAGYDPTLDAARGVASNAKELLQALEARERERTGIGSLKVKYTRVFGYYLEVTKANLGRVPPDYRRKQTVANGERYVTEELEDLETKILTSDEDAKARERELFERLRSRVGREAGPLRRLADAVATVDVHSTLAECAVRYDWVRPELEESTRLELDDSRHPVVEALAPAGSFVPNDVRIGGEQPAMALITGPNMGGKSTLMRQVALTVILAQMGSFVPARAARIGLVDRVHTRVGASDDLSRGQSTFMMEMRETATILREATGRSLVILDELGRGTSTYDGLAIAYAVAEHLHDAIGCRALFATHYHELCALAVSRPGMTNLSVAAREQDGDVVFLHRLVPGPADRSYGVHVAQLAGVPPIVSARAKVLLEGFERDAALAARPQLSLFEAGPAELPEPVRELLATLAELDVNRMTPVDALIALSRLVEIAADVKGDAP